MDLTKEEIEKENLEFLKNNPESPLNKVMAINVFYGTIIPVFITTPFGVTLVGGMYIGTMIGSIVCDLIC